MRAVILSGSGRTADPWHSYAETSAELAAIAREAGFDVEIVLGPVEGFADLADDVRVVIVNAGDPDGPLPDDAPDPGAPAGALVTRAAARFDAALERGIGLLAVHSAAATLRELPAFGTALGARWIAGQSWHPPIGEASVHLVGRHLIREGLDDFTVLDECYTGLPLTGVIEPIAEHEEDGIRHPLVWARELGRSRLVYSALGHDVRSYASAEHRELLHRALRWLREVPAPSTPGAVGAPTRSDAAGGPGASGAARGPDPSGGAGGPAAPGTVDAPDARGGAPEASDRPTSRPDPRGTDA
ncbi:ThuA domain-containing protein [Agromyces silvae]|uniref:ThuA domain-containing protein n=1 Tax=Agromyces silvae TaxID=3388266 RepID=UPI00280B1BCA|nr:ThuA domain-containing protein [Agromyces protaetiae]